MKLSSPIILTTMLFTACAADLPVDEDGWEEDMEASLGGDDELSETETENSGNAEGAQESEGPTHEDESTSTGNESDDQNEHSASGTETSEGDATDDESDSTSSGTDDFAGCIRPSHVSQEQLDATILEFYRYWRQEYVKPSGSTVNGYYIASSGETGSTDGAITVSEAQGFGMIITALMARNAAPEDEEAREIFDGLYRFFKAHPSDASEDLMSWEVLGDGQGGELSKKTSTATDGDIDIAYALLLAHSHWGSSGSIDYLGAAFRVLEALPGHNIGRETKRTTLGSWNDEALYHTRASDWMTGQFNTFAEATGDAYWDAVVDQTYALAEAMVETYAQNTGLVPDFVVNETPEPAEPNFLEFEYDGEYYNNACRVPLRIMIDVCHHETAYAVEWMELLARWVHERTESDPSKIVGGYYIGDGREIRDRQFPAFTAPFVAAATINAEYQGFVNEGWDVISDWRTNYYNDCVNLLSMIQIAGRWWKPEF